MNADYLRSDAIVDCVSYAKIEVVIDNIMGKARERLDRDMPDDIGIVWKAIAALVCERFERVVKDCMEPAVMDVIDDAVTTALKDNDAPELSDLVDLDDSSGKQIGRMLSDVTYMEQEAFFRGLLDGLDQATLANLHAELLRR